MKEAAEENPLYLQSQLITYLGNKRALLPFINEGVGLVKEKLNKPKLKCLDLFSGSGIVSRYLKKNSQIIVANDLENYSCIINRCYLANQNKDFLQELKNIYENLLKKINKEMQLIEKALEKNEEVFSGFISEYYAPKNEDSIQLGERCFYTPYNANYIDISRQLIESQLPAEYREFFIAPLLSEASIHANTAGIFKGFYRNSQTKKGQFGGDGQNALSRIKGRIQLPFPVFSNFESHSRVYNQSANELVLDPNLYDFNYIGDKEDSFDLAYFDPPYNQHPYGSNYFMLNLISNYQKPEVEKMSRVSGIPKDWNRSAYNKQKKVAEVFYELVKNVRAKYVLISFNSEGFISQEEMISLLNKCGTVRVLESQYNTFRGSRNLKAREIHVKEYLFLLEKRN